MQVNGIIAEFNPLHNGHLQLIQQSKAGTGADYTIVVMSGNFVQRGAPAIIDKYDRAKMALHAGADLVLELPAIYSCSSAEYFATGAVALLDKLKVVSHLCFGSECGDLGRMNAIAKILLEEPENFREALLRNVKNGMSYPLARTSALTEYDPSLYDATTILASPNNILAIEYLKAILRRNSAMLPFTIRRMGSGYHDRYAVGSSASSMAIRQAISLDQDISSLCDVMPTPCYEILEKAILEQNITDTDDFSGMLLFQLLSDRDKGYTEYLDVDKELSDRITKNLNRFESFSQFCDLIKSKDRTYTRISRCLLHILLGITDKDMNRSVMIDYAPYARVLGFRKEAETLLTQIKCSSSIPMITKLSDASSLLYAEPLHMLEREMKMENLYRAAGTIRKKTPLGSECSVPLAII